MNYAEELKRRLDEARANGLAHEDQYPADKLRSQRMSRRLAQVQRAIESKVKDRRLHGASLMLLSPERRQMVREIASGRAAYLHGDKGVGKSHFAVCCLREFLENEARRLSESEAEWFLEASIEEWAGVAEYWTEIDLIAALRDCIARDGNPHDIMGRLADAEFLVLDDLGSIAKVTPFVADEVSMLLDIRYRRGMPTLITSNLTLAQYGALLSDALGDTGKHVGERVVSRVHGMIRGIGLGEDGTALWPDAGPLWMRGDDRR